ncbi:MAG: hypothetical protein WKF75_07540 [Singulisphaera sp.]
MLADAQGKEVRVPKDSVEERKVSTSSPMPANLADGIAEPSSTRCSPTCWSNCPARTRPRPRLRVEGSRIHPATTPERSGHGGPLHRER